MSSDKKDFFGKEVTAAIKEACDTLGVSQERLEIEVLETGTTGIFGLIRKKAHIRVQVKEDVQETVADVFEAENFLQPEPEPEPEKQAIPEPVKPVEEKKVKQGKKAVKKPVVVEQDADDDDDDEDDLPPGKETDGEVSAESLEIAKAELLTLVDLMGFPSTVDAQSAGQAVTFTLRGEFEENLIGTDGKVLDSLQYILRKIISRKVPERMRISINVGDFREKRLEELKVKAVELAAQVKEDGKTQVLPALNPSERRAIHMILQEDKEIRSRSVGDGLFKKILIYKPGKGNKPGSRKRPQGKGRPKKATQKKDNDS